MAGIEGVDDSRSAARTGRAGRRDPTRRAREATMSDDSNRVSRRTALKGIAAFAGAGAMGAGTIIYASEPAAAVNHHVEIDDVTIEVSAEEEDPVGIAEFGLSDIWFEAQWENIGTSLYADLGFVIDDANTLGTTLADVDLGVDGEGTETFGYGQTYEDSYDVDLDGSSYLDGGAPLHVAPNDSNGGDFLDVLSLDASESEKTTEIRFGLSLWLAEEDGSKGFTGILENAETYFDVTVKRVLPGAEASDGEADAYGERE